MKWDVKDRSGTVNIDEWWAQIEMKILEAAVYKDAKPEPVNATCIAPWIPPACRAKSIANTEFAKLSSNSGKTSLESIGHPKKLADHIHNGTYNPMDLHSASVDKLRDMCSQVNIPHKKGTTKVSGSLNIAIATLRIVPLYVIASIDKVPRGFTFTHLSRKK